jgi:hypothetical protein
MFIPCRIVQEHVTDLGEALLDRRTLMAVFNEALTPGTRHNARKFQSLRWSGSPFLSCHQVTPGADFTLATRKYDARWYNHSFHGAVVHTLSKR